MRLTFVCSSLEPGRDGVGDYSRRLAAEFIRQGNPSTLLALNDSQISEPFFGAQEMEGIAIPVLRLPASAPWNDRVTTARKWLADFDPDWLSLQFVAFGFHRKGLCFGLGAKLAQMNSRASWHVMFHELWLGIGEDSSLKHRVWGAGQRFIITDLMRRLRPQVVHTQADPYREALAREKISAAILPLFSNVPFVKGDGWTELLEPLATQALGERTDRAKLYLAGIFGAVHPEWNAEQAVDTMLPLVQRSGKKLVLVFLGRSNLDATAFDKLNSTLRDRAAILSVGEKNGVEISKIFQSLDLGVATTPLQIIQKSGSAAAMLDHGLQMLVTRDDWRLRGGQTTMKSARLLTPAQFATLKSLPTRNPEPPTASPVKLVADQMLASMKAPFPGREHQR